MVRELRLLMAGGLLAVALAIVGSPGGARAGGGCHEPAPKEATDAAGSTVEIGSCAFGPTVLRIGPGAFCLLFALPVALPLLLPAIRGISLTAVSPASYGAVWLALGLGAALFLAITSLPRRYRLAANPR